MRENVRVIYGGSNDPIFIKKIALKLWTLRDELEAVIHKRLQNLDPQTDPKQAIADLLEEYAAKTPDAKVLPLETAADEIDPLEAEMAAAIASSQTDTPPNDSADPFEAAQEQALKDEAPSENLIESGTAETSAEDMAAQMLAENIVQDESSPANDKSSDSPDNIVELYQRRPNLPPELVMNGKTVMAEVGMDQIHFFCSQKLLVGQSIVIEFQIPKRFRLCAEVRYCRQYNMKSRIISENALPYRILAQWTYLRPGERTLLRQFIESIEPTVPQHHIKGPIKPSEEADDFDDLDDLDL